jgi:hypothetical protein
VADIGKQTQIIGILSLSLMLILPMTTYAQCNTRGGFVANQPDPIPTDISLPTDPITPPQDPNLPVDPTLSTAPVIPPETPPVTPPVISMADTDIDHRLDDQTLRIDLSNDITSLTEFTGRLTDGVTVLGVRWENTPNFDHTIHCNAIQPIIYKPRIEVLADGKVRASVEDGRFSIEYDPNALTDPWVQDKDPSKQFFWIFPHLYGHSPKLRTPWQLTQSYNNEFKRAKLGSDKRRWIGEAYLNLSMRLYRQRKLSVGFPTGERPTRADLTTALQTRIGMTCDDLNESLICLTSRLIEENEAAPPGNLISPDAFRVGDALLENSGVSTGIRQLDFGTSNPQAAQMVKKLLPRTVGRFKAGAGYRRPIRKWDIKLLNRWYDIDGPRANRELSRPVAKRALISSHVTFLQEAVNDWQAKINNAYPDWSMSDQKALALFAIDLENVSGHRLFLPKLPTLAPKQVTPTIPPPEASPTLPEINPEEPTVPAIPAPEPQLTAPVVSMVTPTETNPDASLPSSESLAEALSQTLDVPVAIAQTQEEQNIINEVPTLSASLAPSRNVCLVLIDRTQIRNKRSNRTVVTNQKRRVLNGVRLLKSFDTFQTLDFKCLN